jgi:hypothetical protein
MCTYWWDFTHPQNVFLKPQRFVSWFYFRLQDSDYFDQATNRVFFTQWTPEEEGETNFRNVVFLIKNTWTMNKVQQNNEVHKDPRVRLRERSSY